VTRDPRLLRADRYMNIALWLMLLDVVISATQFVLNRESTHWLDTTTLDASIVLSSLAEALQAPAVALVLISIGFLVKARGLRRQAKKDPLPEASMLGSIESLVNTVAEIERLTKESGDLEEQRLALSKQAEDLQHLLSVSEPQRRAMERADAPRRRRDLILWVVALVVSIAFSIWGLAAAHAFWWQ
jgi:hypothetical protein